MRHLCIKVYNRNGQNLLVLQLNFSFQVAIFKSKGGERCGGDTSTSPQLIRPHTWRRNMKIPNPLNVLGPWTFFCHILPAVMKSCQLWWNPASCDENLPIVMKSCQLWLNPAKWIEECKYKMPTNNSTSRSTELSSVSVEESNHSQANVAWENESVWSFFVCESQNTPATVHKAGAPIWSWIR